MPSRSRSWSAFNLRDVLAYWDERLPERPWHRGRTVGRTIYKGWGGAEDMIGIMDTPDYAGFVAAMRNILPELQEMATAVNAYDIQHQRWHARSTLSKLWEVLRGRA